MRLKKKCCEKYKKKGKACKRCPIIAPLSKSERKAVIKKGK